MRALHELWQLQHAIQGLQHVPEALHSQLEEMVQVFAGQGVTSVMHLSEYGQGLGK